LEHRPARAVNLTGRAPVIIRVWRKSREWSSWWDGRARGPTTIHNLGAALDIPVGALCHYVLAKWATEGSGGLLELGPRMVRRLASICDAAEAAGTDQARLDAYEQLRGLITWLQFPLDQPDVYE